MTMIAAGDRVDDFTLESTDGAFTLSERVKGGYVLLYFYVVNYGKTCTDYISMMNDRFEEFSRLKTTMFHVNPDTVENHRAWMEHTGSRYVHLSDADQIVSRRFDCIVAKARSDRIIGHTNRAFFLIDPDMVVRYAWRADWPEDTVPMNVLLEEIGRDVD